MVIYDYDGAGDLLYTDRQSPVYRKRANLVGVGASHVRERRRVLHRNSIATTINRFGEPFEKGPEHFLLHDSSTIPSEAFASRRRENSGACKGGSPPISISRPSGWSTRWHLTRCWRAQQQVMRLRRSMRQLLRSGPPYAWL